jgi:glycine hydroxymethyltransferase
MNDFHHLIQRETERQHSELSLIASENYVSKAVLDATGSVLTNKYAEGYPGRRYYAGNAVVDAVETAANRAAQAVYQTDYHVNLQPYSGSPANLAAYAAVLEPGDTVLAMSLAHGGHLTHGHHVSLTGSLYHFVHYGVNATTELIDFDEVRRLALEHRPKLIVCGATAYPMLTDFVSFAQIAQECGALLLADMAHTAGLIAAGVHPTPFGVADLISSSTHKTLRGPRGGMIFCRQELASRVDKAVFPGLQGGPHMHVIAAKGIAFQEASTPAFAQYARQVVSNARTLAYDLQRHDFRLVADGTETHLLLLDLRSSGMRGKEAQSLLETAGLICNKNALPFDPNPPANPSGLRMGTPALTTRGMKEVEMSQIAGLIASLLRRETTPEAARETVTSLARRFRIPAHF